MQGIWVWFGRSTGARHLERGQRRGTQRRLQTQHCHGSRSINRQVRSVHQGVLRRSQRQEHHGAHPRCASHTRGSWGEGTIEQDVETIHAIAHALARQGADMLRLVLCGCLGAADDSHGGRLTGEVCLDASLCVFNYFLSWCGHFMACLVK